MTQVASDSDELRAAQAVIAAALAYLMNARNDNPTAEMADLIHDLECILLSLPRVRPTPAEDDEQ